jgi:hypothetical protein
MVFEILFLILTVGVPIFFTTRTTHAPASLEWSVWEKTMARLIDSDGGFPGCSTLDMVGTIEDLCETSRDKMRHGRSVIVERASPQVIFSCEYTKQSMRVIWRLGKSPAGDLKCSDPGGAMIPHAPGFVFAHDGRMRAFEFVDANGIRQTLPARNCRSKAVLAKNIEPPATLDDFFVQLGPMAGDPKDYIDANFICFVFDLSPLWPAWRARYPR